MRAELIVTVVAVALVSPAMAQGLPTPIQPPPRFFSSQLQPGATLEGIITRSNKLFRELDANSDDLISQADADLHIAATRANLRVGHAVQIMRYDLDGDGGVTEQEIRTRQRYDRRARDEVASQQHLEQANAETELRRVLAADINKDGRVTWQEAADLWATTPNSANVAKQGTSTNVRDVLAFADKSQGSLNAADFQALLSAAFKAADIDGNGTLSQDELGTLQRRAQEQDRLRQAAEARTDCVLAKASTNAKVVLLSANEARGLSSTTIGSQNAEVRTGRIMIEPGTEPLYLVVLSQRATIWRFEGSVERLERVVLASAARNPDTQADKTPLVGAMGPSSSKIQFLPRSDCLGPFSEAPSTNAAATAALVRNETGKDPIVAARYSVSSFSVPSGAITPQPNAATAEKPTLIIQKQSGTLKIDGSANVVVQTGPTNLVDEVKRYYPDGVIEIAPTAVTASSKAEAYDVLPNQAGLLQLVNSGALVERGGEFHIKQKMRFPAGLFGAHSVRFLLLRGVPLPDGRAGHSCVISEETGQPAAGSRNPC